MPKSEVIICIQCSMKAIFEDEEYKPIEETIEAHMLRCHPDLGATQKERVELEQKLAAIYSRS